MKTTFSLPISIKGNLILNGFIGSPYRNLKSVNLALQSPTLYIPSQEIQKFILPGLTLKNSKAIIESSDGKNIKISHLKLGDKGNEIQVLAEANERYSRRQAPCGTDGGSG